HTRLQGDWSSDVCSSDLIIHGTVQADNGAVNLVIGMGDTDADATLIIDGTIIANTVSYTAAGDIILDDLLPGLLNRSGQTLIIRSEERRVGKECRYRGSP